jgi:hypothetical protein
MQGRKRNEILSVEELISQLDHIEIGELASDIRPNVRAELKRMKRNISAILGFLPHVPSLEDAGNSELFKAVLEVRRDCLHINGLISKILLLQRLWLSSARLAGLVNRVSMQYEEMGKWAGQMCQLATPGLTQELLAAL